MYFVPQSIMDLICIQFCAILALTLGVSGTVVDLLSFQQIYLAIWQLSAGG